MVTIKLVTESYSQMKNIGITSSFRGILLFSLLIERLAILFLFYYYYQRIRVFFFLCRKKFALNSLLHWLNQKNIIFKRYTYNIAMKLVVS